MSGTVGIPYYKFLESEFMDSLDALELPEGWEVWRKPGFEPANQRNWLAENFKGDWLLQIDSDQAFNPKALKRLLENNLDIVGGVYYKRGGDYAPAIFQEKGMGANGKWIYHSKATDVMDYLRRHRGELTGNPTDILLKPHPVEVDAIATGFLLVHRRVFEKLSQPYFSFAEKGTEDLYFCRKAKEAGFKIHADLSVQVGHWAKVVVGYPHFLAKSGAIR